MSPRRSDRRRTILAAGRVERYPCDDLLINLVTYAWFPLMAGLVFHAVSNATGDRAGSTAFYLLVFALFVLALAIDFVLIAGYSCYVERSRFTTKVRRALVPLLPSELASALLAVGGRLAYVELGSRRGPVRRLILLVFQYLVGALLVSQERADELELRAQQLAGFQVALLSRAAAHARPARPDDRPPQRRRRPLLARDRAPRRALGRASRSSCTPPACCTTSASSCSPTASSRPAPATTTSSRTRCSEPTRRAPDTSQSGSDEDQPIVDIILAHHERR